LVQSLVSAQSEWMIRVKRIRPGERISIRLTDRERRMILGHTFIGGDLERRIHVAVTDGPAVVIALALDELEDLLGYVAAEANHSKDPSVAKHLSRLHERLSRIAESHADADEPLSVGAAAGPPPPRYTSKQGQYLSFIYYYTKIHRVPPAESDLQAYFHVSAPAVHQMVLTLEGRGFLQRVPGKPRSLQLLLSRDDLPVLE
jgi:DNA-binding MarR family transcriptional regulator